MRSPLLDQSPSWNLAELYLNLGRFTQSLELAYALVQRDGTQSDRYIHHKRQTMRLGAEFSEEVGDMHSAAYYWEQVVQQEPQDTYAWYGLGLAKANLQDFYGAKVALSQALSLEPGDLKIRASLADVEKILHG
jgi:cytochrome c-type biogenesis protein CcmH/NrfG